MSLFLLMFLAVYGGMNAYFFRKIVTAFPLGRWSYLAAGLLMLLVFVPLAVRLAENSGRESLARLLAYVGYGWMGFLLLFVTMALLVDVCRLCGRLAGVPGSVASPFQAFVIPAAVASLVAVYGVFEARAIRTETIDITSPKIPPQAGELRLVQISDVHLGLLVREERLGRILAEVEKARPDMILATGDVVDGQLADLAGLREMLARMNPRLGKIAVTGNHEYYAHLDQSLAFLRGAGFTILAGDHADPLPWLRVAGVDDPAGLRFGHARTAADTPAGRFDMFSVLLKHRPVVASADRGRFDLQLSGHVHQGQIFPFFLITRISYPVPTGLSMMTKDSALYVSRGTGTWGPPMRVLAPPEVTLFRVRHGKVFSASLVR